MASITTDGQGFSIDGRRVHLVSGSVHYARIPRGLWESRLRAARQAGLNCIDIPVVWALHEPRPKHFDFKDQNDLAAFLRLASELRLYTVVRLGPFVGDAYDLGGIPPWVAAGLASAATVPTTVAAAANHPISSTGPAARLRSGDPEFLREASGFISAVCDQIEGYQVTARRKKSIPIPGTLIAVQAEHRWFCGHELAAEIYLHELARFIREGGITVPILNKNNLFQPVEGQIDAWSGAGHLHAVMRQLRHLKPAQPRLAWGVTTADRPTWGHPDAPASPRAAMRAIGEVLAAGGQFNLSPFAAGTNLGFLAGRLEHAPDAFSTASFCPTAPLGEAGQRGPHYHAVKRIATFARSFDRLLTNLHPDYQPASIALDPADAVSAIAAHGHAARHAQGLSGLSAAFSAVHTTGTQGSAVFVFAPANAPDDPKAPPLLTAVTLPDGSTLPVDLTDQSVAWLLLGAHLVGRSTLDYSSLSAFTLVGKTLVVFGRAGQRGLLSINGSGFEVTVPAADADNPLIEEHEGITLVVCNTRQIDAAYATETNVYLGVLGLDDHDHAIPHPDFPHHLRIDGEGRRHTIDPHGKHARKNARPRGKITLDDWAVAHLDDYLEGSSDRYARIDKPAALDALGAPYGYGWFRIRIKSPAARKPKAGFFHAADRLHVYADGHFLETLGFGPGAESNPVLSLPLAKGETTLVVLADNLGRYSEGNNLGELKGLFGHLFEAEPLKPGAPRLEVEDPLDPLTQRRPTFGLQAGDLTDPRRITWKLAHRRKSPVVMVVDPLDPAALAGCTAVVLHHGKIIHVLAPGGGDRVVLADEKGIPSVQVAVVGDPDAIERAFVALKPATHFFDCTDSLTDKAEWAFAKWEPPAKSRFEPLAKGRSSHRAGPRWYRARFALPAAEGPLALHAAGLSKGQIFLNGHNLCRYFAATRTRKAVPPQLDYYLPEPFLHTGPDAANELLIFDEHGAAPDSVTIVPA
ncbi:MAG: beta-galactosidase [Phycisphaerales bacterium]|nr:beta-galactosidase [Phycisphaerales bacterium]